jgi:hypothetical protein
MSSGRQVLLLGSSGSSQRLGERHGHRRGIDVTVVAAGALARTRVSIACRVAPSISTGRLTRSAFWIRKRGSAAAT